MSLQQANIIKLLYNELPKQGVKVSMRGIKEELLSHPHYPSLLSISDYLGTLGVATMSARISIDQLRDALKEANAIIFLEEKGQNYPVLVVCVGEYGISYTSDGKKIGGERLETFSEKWKGITLIFQTEDAIGEKNYNENIKQKQRKNFYYTATIIGATCLLGLACCYSNNVLNFSLMLLTKFVGLFFAILLAATELGFKLPVAEKLCSMTTSHGCEKVMHSKASSITKDIKLADVGLGYFVSVMLCSIIFSFSGSELYVSGMQTLSLLALFCLPFVLFSVIYQTFVVKAHCPLCLGVMVMLLADAAVYWALGYISFSVVSILAVGLVVGVLMLVAGAWMSIKQLIQDRKALQEEHYKFHQLRQHPNRISQAMASVEVEDMGNGDGDIILGCPNPKVVFTEVINPYCGPCGKAINELLPLLDIFPEGLQVRIRFVGNEDDVESDRAILSLYFVSYAATHGQEETKKALVEWYNGMKLEEWRKSFPISNDEQDRDLLLKQLKWGKEAKITHTPTTFCNGKRMPSDIGFNDLRYWLNETME